MNKLFLQYLVNCYMEICNLYYQIWEDDFAIKYANDNKFFLDVLVFAMSIV